MAGALTEVELEGVFKDVLVKVATAIREARAAKQQRIRFDTEGYPPRVILKMVLELLAEQGFVALGVLPGGKSEGGVEHIIIDLTRMRPKGES